jgi:hypothetical protein
VLKLNWQPAAQCALAAGAAALVWTVECGQSSAAGERAHGCEVTSAAAAALSCRPCATLERLQEEWRMHCQLYAGKTCGCSSSSLESGEGQKGCLAGTAAHQAAIVLTTCLAETQHCMDWSMKRSVETAAGQQQQAKVIELRGRASLRNNWHAVDWKAAHGLGVPGALAVAGRWLISGFEAPRLRGTTKDVAGIQQT